MAGPNESPKRIRDLNIEATEVAGPSESPRQITDLDTEATAMAGPSESVGNLDTQEPEMAGPQRCMHSPSSRSMCAFLGRCPYIHDDDDEDTRIRLAGHIPHYIPMHNWAVPFHQAPPPHMHPPMWQPNRPFQQAPPPHMHQPVRHPNLPLQQAPPPHMHQPMWHPNPPFPQAPPPHMHLPMWHPNPPFQQAPPPHMHPPMWHPNHPFQQAPQWGLQLRLNPPLHHPHPPMLHEPAVQPLPLQPAPFHGHQPRAMIERPQLLAGDWRPQDDGLPEGHVVVQDIEESRVLRSLGLL